MGNICIHQTPPWTACKLQVAKPERADVELKGHTDGVCHVAWKPNSPDVLASITNGDKTLRSVVFL